MSFFTLAEIGALRVVQESAFADLCTIQEPSQVADGGGGFSTTWADLAPVSCGVSSPSQAAASGLPILDVGSDERQMIFGFPWDTEIRQGWRVVWGGREFEVTSIQEPGSFEMQITAIGLERD